MKTSGKTRNISVPMSLTRPFAVHSYNPAFIISRRACSFFAKIYESNTRLETLKIDYPSLVFLDKMKSEFAWEDETRRNLSVALNLIMMWNSAPFHFNALACSNNNYLRNLENEINISMLKIYKEVPAVYNELLKLYIKDKSDDMVELRKKLRCTNVSTFFNPINLYRVSPNNLTINIINGKAVSDKNEYAFNTSFSVLKKYISSETLYNAEKKLYTNSQDNEIFNYNSEHGYGEAERIIAVNKSDAPSEKHIDIGNNSVYKENLKSNSLPLNNSGINQTAQTRSIYSQPINANSQSYSAAVNDDTRTEFRGENSLQIDEDGISQAKQDAVIVQNAHEYNTNTDEILKNEKVAGTISEPSHSFKSEEIDKIVEQYIQSTKSDESENNNAFKPVAEDSVHGNEKRDNDGTIHTRKLSDNELTVKSATEYDTQTVALINSDITNKNNINTKTNINNSEFIGITSEENSTAVQEHNNVSQAVLQQNKNNINTKTNINNSEFIGITSEENRIINAIGYISEANTIHEEKGKPNEDKAYAAKKINSEAGRELDTSDGKNEINSTELIDITDIAPLHMYTCANRGYFFIVRSYGRPLVTHNSVLRTLWRKNVFNRVKKLYDEGTLKLKTIEKAVSAVMGEKGGSKAINEYLTAVSSVVFKKNASGQTDFSYNFSKLSETEKKHIISNIFTLISDRKINQNEKNIENEFIRAIAYDIGGKELKRITENYRDENTLTVLNRLLKSQNITPFGSDIYSLSKPYESLLNKTDVYSTSVSSRIYRFTANIVLSHGLKSYNTFSRIMSGNTVEAEIINKNYGGNSRIFNTLINSVRLSSISLFKNAYDNIEMNFSDTQSVIKLSDFHLKALNGFVNNNPLNISAYGNVYRKNRLLEENNIVNMILNGNNPIENDLTIKTLSENTVFLNRISVNKKVQNAVMKTLSFFSHYELSGETLLNQNRITQGDYYGNKETEHINKPKKSTVSLNNYFDFIINYDNQISSEYTDKYFNTDGIYRRHNVTETTKLAISRIFGGNNGYVNRMSRQIKANGSERSSAKNSTIYTSAFIEQIEKTATKRGIFRDITRLSHDRADEGTAASGAQLTYKQSSRQENHPVLSGQNESNTAIKRQIEETFGNLVTGSANSFVSEISSSDNTSLYAGSDEVLRETRRLLTQTTEQVEVNKKMISEIVKKQDVLSEKALTGDDIKHISDKVLYRLKEQIKLESSRHIGT